MDEGFVVALFLGIEILSGDGLLAWSTVNLKHQPSMAWMPCVNEPCIFFQHCSIYACIKQHKHICKDIRFLSLFQSHLFISWVLDIDYGSFGRGESALNITEGIRSSSRTYPSPVPAFIGRFSWILLSSLGFTEIDTGGYPICVSLMDDLLLSFGVLD